MRSPELPSKIVRDDRTDVTTGIPGRNAFLEVQLRDWVTSHQPTVAKAIVDSVPADHPSDAQLVALAKQYFKKFDTLGADPSIA